MIDEPALQPAAPCPDIDLDAVLLDVRAGGQEQAAPGHGSRTPCLAPVRQPLPVRRFAGLDPCLAEDRVAERLDRLVRPLGRVPCPHDPLPAQPADRRIERRQVIADGAGIGGRRRSPAIRPPPASPSCGVRRWASRSPRSDIPPSPGGPSRQRSRSNFSHCSWPQCGHGTKNRRWSLASNSRSIRLRPRIVGVETRNTLRRWAKVSDRASASVTGSPSSSADAG